MKIGQQQTVAPSVPAEAQQSNAIDTTVSRLAQATKYGALASSLSRPFAGAIAAQPEGAAQGPLAALTQHIYSETRDPVMTLQDIKALLTHRHTRPVMLGVIACLTRRPGHVIFLSPNTFKSYNSAPNAGGFFNGNNSIVLRYDNVNMAMGLFTHEGMHLVVQNACGTHDPAVLVAEHRGISRDDEAALFDEAIARDRAHRASLPDGLDGDTTTAYQMFAGMESNTYFNGSVNALNAEDRELLRTETVVRVPQLSADGKTRDVIRNVAPNTLHYYETRVEPALHDAVESLLAGVTFDPCLAEEVPMQATHTPDVLVSHAKEAFKKLFGDAGPAQPSEELDAYFVSQVMQGFRAYGFDGSRFSEFKAQLRAWMKDIHGYEYERQS